MSSDGAAATRLTAQALLDALPDATVVLDHAGTITAVNRVWRMFGLDNGADPTRTGVGVNYIEVCTRSAANGCPDAATVATGLGAVLKGEPVYSELEYPCTTSTAPLWFLLSAPRRRRVRRHRTTTLVRRPDPAGNQYRKCPGPAASHPRL
jgi:hypothetical protein